MSKIFIVLGGSKNFTDRWDDKFHSFKLVYMSTIKENFMLLKGTDFHKSVQK